MDHLHTGHCRPDRYREHVGVTRFGLNELLGLNVGQCFQLIAKLGGTFKLQLGCRCL